MIHDHMAHFFMIKSGSKFRDQLAHFFIDIHKEVLYMSVTIRPYSSEYESGVITLLKRNYIGLSKKTDAEVSNWGKPIFSQSWEECVEESEFPYKYGAIILDDNKVVGFLGCISAIRYAPEGRYISTSGTTWAIDAGYRIYMFKGMKLAFKDADFVIDLTPIPSVETALRDVLKLNVISSIMYRYYPIPRFLGKTMISMINSGVDIDDSLVRKEYNDHVRYSVKCLSVHSKGARSYVFFSVRKRYIKGIVPIYIARILKTTNKDHAWDTWKDVIWFIQKEYALIVECDEHFVKCVPPDVPYIERIKTKRYIKNHCLYDVDIDYLYTEYAVLPV